MIRRQELLVALALAIFAGCASTKAVDPGTERPHSALDDWSNVEKLRIGTPVRVTERDGERFYGRVMSVTSLRLTLELVDASQSVERNQIALVERFPAHFPSSFTGGALGLGAALALSSSSTPDTYRRSAAPAQETLDKASIPTRTGYYVDALELVGRGIEMVDRAIESSRTTVVVYRR